MELTKIIHKYYADDDKFRSNRPACIKQIARKMEELFLPYEIVTETIKRRQTYRIERKTEIL